MQSGVECSGDESTPALQEGRSHQGHHRSRAVMQASWASTWCVVLEDMVEIFNIRYMEDYAACQKAEVVLRTQEAECSSVEGTLAQQALSCGGDLDSLESFSCSWANGYGARDSSYESCSASAQTRRSDAVREAVASVVRCDTTNSGCNGGWLDKAFSFAETNSVCTEGSSQTPQLVGLPSGHFSGGVVGYTDVSTDSEQTMMLAVAQQPVSIAIEALLWCVHRFMRYMSRPWCFGRRLRK